MKIASEFQVISLLGFLATYLTQQISEQNCIDTLFQIDFLDITPKEQQNIIEKCISYAASNSYVSLRHPRLPELKWDFLKKILTHPNLTIASEGSIPPILTKWIQEHPADIANIFPYLQISYYTLKPKFPIGSWIVCFYADGSEKYTEMTVNALVSFLTRTPKILVGLLTPNENVKTVVMRKIPVQYHHRVISKSSSSAIFKDWNPTQFKLDIKKYVLEDGFETVFWFDSDTITIKDCTNFLSSFAQDPSSFFYFVADHVMFDQVFQSNWRKTHSECMIPQACVMGFKAAIVHDFFEMWQEEWRKWIEPKPFSTFPDPNPGFSGSAFCIEQYALGISLNQFLATRNLKTSVIKMFERNFGCVDMKVQQTEAHREMMKKNLAGSFWNLSGNIMWNSGPKPSNANLVGFVPIWNLSLMTSLYTSKLPQNKSYDPGNQLVVDFFGESIVHCYNHQYAAVKEYFSPYLAK